MFDRAEYQPYRPVVPPRPVQVRAATLLPTGRVGWGSNTALWARAQGLDAGATLHGRLLAWVISSTGRWFGLCVFTVTSSVGDLQVTVTQLVPGDEITPLLEPS
ncbi:hypothetical protein GCM10010174_88320 [Kutzneria viridogrisea]|uniref:Uncharacterized protein n=1 Tax=Kutzneria viridogrisea TaxID=47990 RepID=A0ABR6C019_9PSEU|nr:hypothetical protein [Kutzneria viridogrisea]